MELMAIQVPLQGGFSLWWLGFLNLPIHGKNKLNEKEIISYKCHVLMHAHKINWIIKISH